MKNILQFFRSIWVFIWTMSTTVILGIFLLIIRIFSKTAPLKLADFWFSSVRIFSGVKIKVTGKEKLKEGAQYIFLANHQSIMDILVMYQSLPYRLCFIAKKSLFNIPFFGWCMSALGHISVDRSDPRKAKVSIERACANIKKGGRSIFGFPEGTRSVDGVVAPFKLGIFKVALMAEVDVVPITINGTRFTAPKKSLMIKPGYVELIIHDPIRIQDFKMADKGKLADVTREAILNGHHTEQPQPAVTKA